ncbi:MAG: hypothetical protein NTY19_19655 [Planctomycetota bacterium]|nr:hypothetical protein [Planctomycetota bacterium]
MTVDALKYMDPDWDVVSGDWRREGDGLTTEPSKMSRVMLPFEIRGEYDIEAEFTRTKGSESVTFNLPVGSRACTLHFGSFLGGVAGLERIDGKDIGDGHDPAVRRPGGLVNGVPHTLLVAVRLLPCPRSDDHDVLIDVWLDGRPFVRWSGRESSLDLAKWTFPELRRVGLGSNVGLVKFHTVRLRKVESP